MLSKMKINNICCIGAGYVGGPTMTVLADKCPNLKVNVVDTNKKRIALWNNKDLSNLPIYEPGLSEIIGRARGKNLFFTSDVEESLKIADMVFISVNTPIKKKGIGAGQACDLRWVEASARQIAKFCTGKTIVVEKSTLPVKTSEVIEEILVSTSKSEKGKEFYVLSNPEFLAEGSAVENLLNPDRVLIGGDNQNAIQILKEIYLNWVKDEKIISTNLWSSELSKLISNAFLAQRISSINTVSAICEETGANIREVSTAVGYDSRIGKNFLQSGPGFGGSCFKKDISNLVYLCNHFELKEVANFWEQVLLINSWQKNRIYRNIVSKLYGNVANKRIAILGASFKANTNDLRESPSIEICKKLIEEEAYLIIHDPQVSQESLELELESPKGWEFQKNINKVFIDVDAIIILTEWEIYKSLDWLKIYPIVRRPSWVFDTRHFIDADNVKKSGFKFWQVGSCND